MCRGVTHRGRPCKSRAFAEYCRPHINQTPIPLYTPPAGWPASDTFIDKVLMLPYRNLSADMVIFQLSLLRENLWLIPPDPSSLFRDIIKRDHRTYLMLCTELIKLNAVVCYNDDRVQDLATGMSIMLDQVPELAEYAEDFRRKCLRSHREAARKRMVSFYFTRCEDLCDDVIEKVLGMM